MAKFFIFVVMLLVLGLLPFALKSSRRRRTLESYRMRLCQTDFRLAARIQANVIGVTLFATSESRRREFLRLSPKQRDECNNEYSCYRTYTFIEGECGPNNHTGTVEQLFRSLAQVVSETEIGIDMRRSSPFDIRNVMYGVMDVDPSLHIPHVSTDRMTVIRDVEECGVWRLEDFEEEMRRELRHSLHRQKLAQAAEASEPVVA